MTAFRQISENEWKRGDYRAGATINRKVEELFRDYPVNFIEYLEEGLGKAKTAAFITSNNRQFAVTEYLENDIPITVIIILNNPETMTDDLNEVLEILGLNYSDLHFVHKY